MRPGRANAPASAPPRGTGVPCAIFDAINSSASLSVTDCSAIGGGQACHERYARESSGRSLMRKEAVGLLLP